MTVPTPVAPDERYDYSPITTRLDAVWPEGKKLAVYIAIGLESYTFGTGMTENLMEGVAAPDLVNTSWRDYGNRVGGFRLLQRLEQFGIPSTVLLNTAVYDAAPELLAEARRLGSEIIGHGISNSDSLSGMTEQDELAYLDAVAARISVEEGAAPRGWSSPWLTHTERTIDLLGEAGYEYLLDLRLDDRPVWLNTREAPLLALPYALELNDSTTIIGRGASASEFADMIIDEFDELLEAAGEQRLVMSIVVHSFISGVPFRLKQLSRALEHLTNHRADVWFAQPRDIHEAMTAQSAQLLPQAVDDVR
ncbi:polysaccharide deacetylase family protein [Cryobacterium soli]|jgi:peptidoglycan/xylan/chitin deacetylase (PgdA/CDA1 family)|uniref:polysaccharide deacetylase family protein n=1 Tax=Cryobacterium soli TaxID=2220095 RepID=UPI000E71A2A1|nr:polysaccharide deacetylase family protein [Cryobacterium soli]